MSGPGSGIARFVMEGYRSVTPRGRIRSYIPTPDEMRRTRESIAWELIDEVIPTGLDYPLRDIFQVRASDAMFILTGGDATLQEALPALGDYNLPVAAVRGTGVAVEVLERLQLHYRNWSDRLLIADDVAPAFEGLCKMIGERSRHTR